ncbi:hypothetical protein [Flavobacterium cerinum]|uniref:Uncharacterized protein n=1 Tax=Flavobacterium cerinum TaxID=2502784 RepID=A0ABY5IWG9_9FLAO|nr:hypothetical protein [Flavobacterium cerinum]UUC45694.1 hypothetical protein NOX80_00430 [Flavobacterium cerinum]
MIYIALVLLLIPLVFQIRYGNRAIRGATNMSLGVVTLFSFAGQILITLLSIGLAIMVEGFIAVGEQPRCGSIIPGIFVFGFMFLPIIIFVLMLIQWYVKRSY